MTYVFVYGSLKRGFHNNDLFTPGYDHYIKTTTTSEPIYEMYSLGAFPAVTDLGNSKIEGEIYEIDDRTLPQLDHLESNGSMYQRKLISLDNFEHQAWIYLWLDPSRLFRLTENSHIETRNNIKIWNRR